MIKAVVGRRDTAASAELGGVVSQGATVANIFRTRPMPRCARLPTRRASDIWARARVIASTWERETAPAGIER